jgi:hypothetical protein
MTRLGEGAVCSFLRGIGFALLTSGLASFAVAQVPGVTDSSLLVGSCSALDGPAHFLGRQTVLGQS